MKMACLLHKPTGRKLNISENHAVSLLKRKENDYEEIEMVAPPVVEAPAPEVEDEDEAPEPVAKKKVAKKKVVKK